MQVWGIVLFGASVLRSPRLQLRLQDGRPGMAAAPAEIVPAVDDDMVLGSGFG
ncbi:hypothetical protein LINGRAHAP2_LOCUS6891 [Linum grandiflorum]